MDAEQEWQLMLAELTAGIFFGAAIFLIIILVGSDLFDIMVDNQIRNFRLIILYARLPALAGIPGTPTAVARYVSWALGEHSDPVDCASARYTGSIRYSGTGRWMKMDGAAFFSLAVPGYIWHAKIACAREIWIEEFDYYVHDKTGMNLSLLSAFPLNNLNSREIRGSSLFRYLASAPCSP